MKGFLSWLVHLTRRAGTIHFYPALAALVGPVHNIIFLTAHFFTLLEFRTHRLATWEGSRAGSPVSVFSVATQMVWTSLFLSYGIKCKNLTKIEIDSLNYFRHQSPRNV